MIAEACSPVDIIMKIIVQGMKSVMIIANL
jgi:hypothetical protein